MQVLGIVLGFMYAWIIQRRKSQRDAHTGNNYGHKYSNSLRSSPAYIGYSQITNQGEVEYI